MIIFLIATVTVTAATHLFLMKSVDNYSGYGYSEHEWEVFQSERLKY
jgi:hypothetical protein